MLALNVNLSFKFLKHFWPKKFTVFNRHLSWLQIQSIFGQKPLLCQYNSK